MNNKNDKMEDIKKIIDSCEIVSFDIFDTLLFRNIACPTDIFKIIAKQIKDKFDFDNFFDIRIRAEQEARNIVENGEANYNEIYNCLEKMIGNSKISDYAKKVELDLEYEFSDCNPFMKQILEYAIKKNKKVCLISDMYLEKSFIEKILKKSGYNISSQDIYISNDYRKNKGTGTLYQHVCNLKNYSFDKWVHIGDNTYSDYKKPLELGMKAYNYKNVSTYDCVKYNSIAESIILGIQNNYLYNGLEKDYWDRFGVLYISPIYFGFTDWLYKMTINCDNLFFLARDGYLIEKIYKLFPGTSKKDIKYIYGSRKTIQLPAMLDSSKDYMLKFLTQSNDLDSSQITLGKLFENCRLNKEKKYIPAIRSYGFKGYDDVITDSNRYSAIKLIANFYDDIAKVLSDERKIVCKYLKQEGLYNYNKVNVVDVGWGGSIQNSLRTLLNKEVRGYYFGTIDTDKKDYLSDSFGYYFDLDNPINNKKDVFSQVMMYEIIFSAPHGSTIGYKEEKGKIIPILNDNKDYNSVVEKFQNSSLNIIKKYMQYYSYFEDLDREFCLKRYKEFLSSYNYDDMVMFSKISNDFVIGSDETYPYVETIQKNEIKDYYKRLFDGKSKSLWKGAYVISGIDNKDDAEKFLKKNKIKIKNVKSLVNPSKKREIFRKYVPLCIRKKLVKIIRI